MAKTIFEGFLLGLTVAILIGPAFFALLQTSIVNGFKSGVSFAGGILLSDVLFVFLAYLGAFSLFENPENKTIVGIVGGFILIGFGLFNLFQKHHAPKDVIQIKKIDLPLIALKGFVVNTLNPFVFIFWIGAVGIVSSRQEVSTLTHTIIFFTTTLGTVFLTDVLKAYIARKIRDYLSAKRLMLVNRIAGALLIIFGISLMYRVLV